MTAVSALEEDPPRRPATGKKSEPLHWMLLATEGEAGLETARTVLRWYELRWRIEDFFHALKVGTRIEDRRLDEADDLKKCLAFERDHRVPGLGPLPPRPGRHDTALRPRRPSRLQGSPGGRRT